jgi:sulfoxide reductase heme-binding subunit YedZ
MNEALSSGALWYLIRGSGVVALLLLTGTVALGIATANHWGAAGVPRFVTAALHRSVALLSVVFLGIHVLTSILDTYVSIGAVDAFVPFAGSVHPLALGLGAVGFDLVLALVVTSLARARLGLRTWRVVHWLAYLAWPVALLHGLAMGTDAATAWNVTVVAACVLVVAAAVGWRVQSTRVRSAEGVA